MKKLVCILLTLYLVLSLAGCAGSANGAAPANSPAAQEPASPSPAPANTPAPAPTENPNEPIVFTDAAFEAGVRKALNKPDGDITRAEAAAVESLNLELPGDDWSIPRIADLSDLKYFPNLTSLFLGWALQKPGGVDISPIGELTKLEGLYMPCTSIADIAPIASLTNLQELSLWGVRTITDISPLSGLAELKNLQIKGNTISDLTPLAGLKKLENLTLEENMISDISPLAGLTGLKGLKLSDNPILNYTPVSAIYPNLQDKDFELLDHSLPIVFSNPILEKKIRSSMGKEKGDITPEMAKEVTELNLGNDFGAPDDVKIQDISSLRYFPNLTKLDLHFNKIDEYNSNLHVILGMKNLTILDLNGNSLSGCDIIAGCSNLSWLQLSGFRGEDLQPLTRLKGLKNLFLSYSPTIRDISPLAQLTNLEELRLENVMISDYSPLAKLNKLKTLYINTDGKTDLSSLKDIYPNLTDKNFEIK